MWHTADKHVPAETLRVRGQNSLEDCNTQAAVSTTELEKKLHVTQRFSKKRDLRRHSRLDALRCAHPSVGHADDPGVAAAHQEDEAEQRHVPSARHKTGVYERWRWEKALGEARQNRRRHQNASAPAEASVSLNTLRIPLYRPAGNKNRNITVPVQD